MMGFPDEGCEIHYVRHRDFFEDHGITIDDPLGEFHQEDGLLAATSTRGNSTTPSSRAPK